MVCRVFTKLRVEPAQHGQRRVEPIRALHGCRARLSGVNTRQAIYTVVGFGTYLVG